MKVPMVADLQTLPRARAQPLPPEGGVPGALGTPSSSGGVPAAHEQLHHLLAHSPAVIYALRLEGENLVPYLVSPNITELWGFAVQDALRSEWWLEQVHPQDRERALAGVRLTQSSGAARTEYRFRHQDGSYRWVEDTQRLIRNSSGEPQEVTGVWSDISDRKEAELRLETHRQEMETQVRQAQKMEAIGQLAGGMAHEFNNMLFVINGYSGMLLSDESSAAELQEGLQQIYSAGEKAAGLTRQLLMFSRQQEPRLQPVDLNDVIEDVAKLLPRLLSARISLKTDLSPGPALIEADPGMIEQALLNLAANSGEAMPEGGVLSISARRRVIDESYVQHHLEARIGEFVCLAVQDSGAGIPPEILPRIFEPFFTTKEIGRGTGLGLATVFGIVQQHHGWIEVESEVKAGAVFRAFFPATQAPGGQRAPAGIVQKGNAGNETLLVVEDEAAVRGLAILLLRKHGYRVLEAASGEEALQVFKRHGSRIQLLLTDLVMPGKLTGRDLAHQLRALNPNLKVIYASGYSAEMTGRVFGIKEKIRFLQKPYAPRKLAEAVRQTLDEKPASVLETV